MSDDREVMYIEAEGGSGFKWFILGAALGAGLGLLLAPQSGERTRRDLTRKARKLKRQAGEKIEELADEVQDRGKRLKESAEDLVEDFADEVRGTRRKVERSATTAREDLERRLAEARARRRAAIAPDGVDDEDETDDEEDDDDETE